MGGTDGGEEENDNRTGHTGLEKDEMKREIISGVNQKS